MNNFGVGECHQFIKRIQDELFIGGQPIHLKGVCFGNHVWSDIRIPVDHHDEKDYERLKSWGANVVRFYLNYLTFESDDRPCEYRDDGLRWLDENISWAKKNGILIILSLYMTQGAADSGDGAALIWSDSRYRDRVIALWKAIASRYRNEPTVAGYDLFHHPVPLENRDNLWLDFANQIADGIRNVDPHHLLIVQGIMRLRPEGGTMIQSEEMVRIDDENTLYEFHFFEPLEYTHQHAPWFPLFSRGNNYSNKHNSEFPRNHPGYVISRLEKIADWGKRHHVPLYCGEFGLLYFCFADQKGGRIWLDDVLTTLHRLGVHYTYHNYHEAWFGAFRNERGLPDSAAANPILINCLEEWFHHTPRFEDNAFSSIEETERTKGFTTFLDKVKLWALEQTNIQALLLVGSYARGQARDNSDIDLVILTTSPSMYNQESFPLTFGIAEKSQIEDWGRVTSVRIWYQNSFEVEFGITTPDWILEPLDPGTLRVISDGVKIIFDRTGDIKGIIERNCRESS